MLRIYRYLILFELYGPHAGSHPYHVSRILEQRRPLTAAQVTSAQTGLADEMHLDYTPQIYKLNLLH